MISVLLKYAKSKYRAMFLGKSIFINLLSVSLLYSATHPE